MQGGPGDGWICRRTTLPTRSATVAAERRNEVGRPYTVRVAAPYDLSRIIELIKGPSSTSSALSWHSLRNSELTATLALLPAVTVLLLEIHFYAAANSPRPVQARQCRLRTAPHPSRLAGGPRLRPAALPVTQLPMRPPCFCTGWPPLSSTPSHKHQMEPSRRPLSPPPSLVVPRSWARRPQRWLTSW